MSRKSCQSNNGRKFDAEINIHLPGLERLDKPMLFFPRLVVWRLAGLWLLGIFDSWSRIATPCGR